MTATPYREKWVSDCGTVTLYCGDCLEVLPTLEAGSVDAVVTSPPYNQLGSRMPDKPSGMHSETRWVTNTKSVGYADDMPEDEYQSWHNGIMEKCAVVIRDGGSLFVNHKCRWRDKVLIHPARWITAGKMSMRQEIIWMRAGSTTLNARMFAPNDERILWFVNGTKWKWNQPSASLLSVWKITQDSDPNGHPCPFPEELPTRCIESVTSWMDTVMEPFMGSGTTGVACVRLGRRFIGIELEPKYFEIAKRRIIDELNRVKFLEPPKRERQKQLIETE